MDHYQLMEEKKAADDIRYINEAQLAAEAQEALRNHTNHLLMDFRMAYVEQQLKDLMQQIASSSHEPLRMQQLLAKYKEIQQIRNVLAKRLGSNIVS